MDKFSIVILALALAWSAAAESPRQLRISVHNEPKTFDPMLVEDEAAQLIRYMTGGVLIRVNRSNQRMEPELASSWAISADGRKITFNLRREIRFSDGSPFDSSDVAYTIKMLFDPKLHSPTADAFRSSDAAPVVEVLAPDKISVAFSKPVASLARLFDEVAIVSARSKDRDKAFLGPFSIAEYKPGAYVLLNRNAEYWKKDEQGRRLPYLDSVHVQIQTNRDLEAVAFHRGDLDVITPLDPTVFEQLQKEDSRSVQDLGASSSSEFLWFNQVPGAAIPAYKKAWFRQREFRNAISMAINRNDLCRIVYSGHAVPAVGPFPATNQLWFAKNLKPHVPDQQGAKKLLEQSGFHYKDGVLTDSGGNPVSFSLVTNAGNNTRAKIAALVQSDLRTIGIEMKIVALDFSGLISRITRTFEYEACLLGLVNVDADPSGQMNVWLSSSSNHQWNPSQKTAATPWEHEIDKDMLAQASEPDEMRRKELFNRVQEIARTEEPFVYLVHPNALVAVSQRVKNVSKSPLPPQVLATVDRITISN